MMNGDPDSFLFLVAKPGAPSDPSVQSPQLMKVVTVQTTQVPIYRNYRSACTEWPRTIQRASVAADTKHIICVNADLVPFHTSFLEGHENLRQTRIPIPVQRRQLLGAKTLLGAPGRATRNKKLRTEQRASLQKRETEKGLELLQRKLRPTQFARVPRFTRRFRSPCCFAS